MEHVIFMLISRLPLEVHWAPGKHIQVYIKDTSSFWGSRRFILKFMLLHKQTSGSKLCDLGKGKRENSPTNTTFSRMNPQTKPLPNNIKRKERKKKVKAPITGSMDNYWLLALSRGFSSFFTSENQHGALVDHKLRAFRLRGKWPVNFEYFVYRVWIAFVVTSFKLHSFSVIAPDFTPVTDDGIWIFPVIIFASPTIARETILSLLASIEFFTLGETQ